ncbi:MAG TPA: phosphate ABC transporter ATP-binding protein [Methanomassiliicoccales archaeon]|nr:phosphate ABC transporter ATP-binding protein [Methanomassiliicoccales archaeon]
MSGKIEAEGVTVSAQGKDIIKEVTTSIPEKEIFTIVGPSGAGKSTFLRTINRLIDFREGDIRLDGRSIREYEPVELRKRVGMVFQIPLAFQGTVEDNLLMGPRLTGSAEPDLDELLDMVGLARGFVKRKASELSVGEQQRMCIARAIANGPEVILMDEPTASLDPESARKVEELIMRLSQEVDLTLVVVTHNMEQGMRIGDWTMLMKEGRAVTTMKTDEFFEMYPGVLS